MTSTVGRSLAWLAVAVVAWLPAQAHAVASYSASGNVSVLITVPTSVSVENAAQIVAANFVLDPTSGLGLTHSQSGVSIFAPGQIAGVGQATGSADGTLGGRHVDSFGNSLTKAKFTNLSGESQHVGLALTFSWAISGQVDNPAHEFALASALLQLDAGVSNLFLVDELETTPAAFSADDSGTGLVLGFDLGPNEVLTLSLLIDVFGSADFVPAPAALALLVPGLVAAAWAARRRRA